MPVLPMGRPFRVMEGSLHSELQVSALRQASFCLSTPSESRYCETVLLISVRTQYRRLNTKKPGEVVHNGEHGTNHSVRHEQCKAHPIRTGTRVRVFPLPSSPCVIWTRHFSAAGPCQWPSSRLISNTCALDYQPGCSDYGPSFVWLLLRANAQTREHQSF